jgi:hypothetical protein
MERLLQQFEHRVSDRDGETYDVFLYGRSRPGDTWQGWLAFERTSDGARFTTDVETTQPNAEAVLYWATGLTEAYFDGALARARKPQRPPQPIPVIAPAATLAQIERDVLAFFTRHRILSARTQVVLDGLPHAHADIVRALEDLEKQARYLVRRTEEGNDWLFLTEEGTHAIGLGDIAHVTETITADPPNSAR